MPVSLICRQGPHSQHQDEFGKSISERNCQVQTVKRCGYVLKQNEISVHVLTLIIITAMLKNTAVPSRHPPRTADSGDSRSDTVVKFHMHRK